MRSLARRRLGDMSFFENKEKARLGLLGIA